MASRAERESSTLTVGAVLRTLKLLEDDYERQLRRRRYDHDENICLETKLELVRELREVFTPNDTPDDS